jgi:YidC/Oxa1 family membrane protein insertase
MGITMWVQMQLNPQQADPIQQKVFNWMPVMFTFLLGNFASGLVIYWAWNNLLSLTQQYIIMKRNGAEIHLWKNLGVEKLLVRVRDRVSGLAFGSSAPQSSRQGSGQSSGQSSGKSPAAEAVSSAADAPAADGKAQPAPTDGDGRAAPAKAAMTREQALRTLGLAPGATAAQIEAAYRARARQRGGSLNGSERLSQAREVLRGEGT